MNVLITGVSKSLGLETAKVMLHRGWNVYGVSRTHTNELNELIATYNNSFRWLKYDLEDTEGIHKTIFKDWIGNETVIDGLVNNAAIAYDDLVTNLGIKKLEILFRTNVYSPMLLSKYAIRHMLLHHNKLSIVHLSSISAHTGYKGLAMYASSKGAIEAFSKNISREWGELGVRSNCVVPGFMETTMSDKLTNDQKDRIYKRTSLKKAVDIKSVASLISFLISDDASSITGQNYFIDNGTI
jgi:3-oxoacyl-[acyl-carrier protein] reductase